MIRKTQKHFQRFRKSGIYVTRHKETVLRETWWLFWVIPVYSRERILTSNL